MVKPVKVCLQWSLKFTNLTIGFVGIAILFYGIWLIRVWQRDAADSHSSPDYDHFPWFIHASLGIGTALCAITCLGHVAANSANTYCLSSYMFVIFVLLLSEIGVAADVLLNSNWEKDLPEDPSGRFNDFEEFVKSNSGVFQWIAVFSVLAQGCSMLFATMLRTIGKVKEYTQENEGEYAEPWDPLLRPPELPPATMYPPYVIGEPVYKGV
uniref:Tetraspanin-19 n=1 Tax=Nicotiana tabacum TaxID=4097 RepID=A0A1S3YJ60_TOBAC|nr:PREDICTED: tetraspanin-19-like [Nicotiana tabacum]XP_016452084.1 PREDICTED: tetraspanin-19-like [Nicotiana tabacum]